MAELFRVTYRLVGNSWENGNEVLFFDAETINNVEIPDYVKEIDVVAHRLPGKNRFTVVVGESLAGEGRCKIEAIGCMRKWKWYAIPVSCAKGAFAKAIKKAGLKPDCKIYLQVEC